MSDPVACLDRTECVLPEVGWGGTGLPQTQHQAKDAGGVQRCPGHIPRTPKNKKLGAPPKQFWVSQGAPQTKASGGGLQQSASGCVQEGEVRASSRGSRGPAPRCRRGTPPEGGPGVGWLLAGCPGGPGGCLAGGRLPQPCQGGLRASGMLCSVCKSINKKAFSARCGARTHDHKVKSLALYRLS